MAQFKGSNHQYDLTQENEVSTVHTVALKTAQECHTQIHACLYNLYTRYLNIKFSNLFLIFILAVQCEGNVFIS